MSPDALWIKSLQHGPQPDPVQLLPGSNPFSMAPCPVQLLSGLSNSSWSVQQLALLPHSPNMHHELLSGQLTERSHSGEKEHPFLDSARKPSLQRHYSYGRWSEMKLSLVNNLLVTLSQSLSHKEIQFQVDQN